MDARDQLHFILQRAVEKGASDIHIKCGMPPVVRVNGNLFFLGLSENLPPSPLEREWIDKFVEVLNEKLAPSPKKERDFAYSLPTSHARFRVNLCLQNNYPRLVFRQVPEHVPPIKALSLPSEINSILNAQRGLVLVTGATGSGKSTTLASLLSEISERYSYHILTIEDPIEYIFKDKKSIFTQREIGTDTDNFVSAIKFGLRQDPDVIFIGEIRDAETLDMALTAAETGHLVFSTLHTLDAKETIARILSMVPKEKESITRLKLTACLVAVVSQRLLSQKTNNSKPKQVNTQVPALEILLMNARMRELFLDPKRFFDIQKAIEESFGIGMMSFDQSIYNLLEQGLITEQEALANCSSPKDFLLKIKGVSKIA